MRGKWSLPKAHFGAAACDLVHVRVVRRAVGDACQRRSFNALSCGPHGAGVAGVFDDSQMDSTIRPLDLLALYLKDRKDSGRGNGGNLGAFKARPNLLLQR